MSVNVKTTLNLHASYTRKTLLLASLLFTMILVFPCFTSTLNNNVSSFATGASNKIVSNETELRNAINNAKEPTTIALSNDITLTEELVIPTNKDITLTSNKANGYYKLIGAANKFISDAKNTIVVECGGVLRLDGIIITHVKDDLGSGIVVNASGQLFMHNGEISGNRAVLGGNWGSSTGLNSFGGGVQNFGVFEMHGGKISNNEAVSGFGGGVYNKGTFKMLGGEISNNKVIESTSTGGFGGGVYNCVDGHFVMSGGTISNNKAVEKGGGVCNQGVFERLGGVISGNTDWSGNENDVYTQENNNSSDGNGSGSSSNGGSSDGNNGTSNGDEWTNNGNNNIIGGDGFSLRDIVFICVGVGIVVVGVVVAVLLFTFKKELEYTRRKIHNNNTENQT